jgi:hypothetical protein
MGCYGGVFYASHQFAVFALQFSGAALRAIREASLLRDLCMLINDTPHTITRLDATCDYAEDAPRWLSKLYYRIRRTPLAVGKKLITFRDVERHTSVNSFGQTVGNLYLGKRTAEIRVLVYDKRHEMLSKGAPDCGDCLRVEVRLKSQVGCTIWDALQPERVYYHYAAPGLIDLPESVRPWEANGQGFEVPLLQSHYTNYERLRSMIGESVVIDRMLRLCHGDGAGGLKTLFTLLQRRDEVLAAARLSKLPLVA